MGGRIKRIFAIVLGAGAVLSAYASSALADHGTLRDPRETSSSIRADGPPTETSPGRFGGTRVAIAWCTRSR